MSQENKSTFIKRELFDKILNIKIDDLTIKQSKFIIGTSIKSKCLTIMLDDESFKFDELNCIDLDTIKENQTASVIFKSEIYNDGLSIKKEGGVLFGEALRIIKEHYNDPELVLYL
jgi:hypothetical protein